MGSKRNRNLAIGAIVAVALVLAVFLLAGDDDNPTPYADDGPATDTGVERRPIRAFGQTVRLRTYLTTIELRPTGFDRVPASESSAPGVTVDLTIRNVGRAPYRDQPLQAASVALRQGGEAERAYEPRPGCTNVPEDTVRIPPGGVRRYCLPFAATQRPELFLYSAEAGLPTSRGAPEAAAWSFPQR